MDLTPKEVLDQALGYEPGMGVPIEFASRAERDSFKQALYAAMSSDARASKGVLDMADPEWGQHRWKSVRIEQLGLLVLWVGRRSEIKVGAPIAFDAARKGGQDE